MFENQFGVPFTARDGELVLDIAHSLLSGR